MKRIGILAGMGPRTTSPFLELVLDEAQKHGAMQDSDYPHILIYSLPTPFYVDRAIDHESMRKALTIGIKSLIAGGIDLLAMPCNSVHRYFDDIQDDVNRMSPNHTIPVMHIVKETMKKIPKATDKVAVLASQMTIDSGLYDELLQSSSISMVYTDSLQAQVNALILNLKKEGFSSYSKTMWRNILVTISDLSVSAVIIACTDLSICLNDTHNPDNLLFLDSSNILAEATFKKYLEMS